VGNGNELARLIPDTVVRLVPKIVAISPGTTPPKMKLAPLTTPLLAISGTAAGPVDAGCEIVTDWPARATVAVRAAPLFPATASAAVPEPDESLLAVTVTHGAQFTALHSHVDGRQGLTQLRSRRCILATGKWL
jgi:hypothetical protein